MDVFSLCGIFRGGLVDCLGFWGVISACFAQNVKLFPGFHSRFSSIRSINMNNLKDFFISFFAEGDIFLKSSHDHLTI